jgi:hypothetical protein
MTNGVTIWNYFFDKVKVFDKSQRCKRCHKRIKIGVKYGNDSPISSDSMLSFYMCKKCHIDWHRTLQAKNGKFHNLWDGELWEIWFGDAREVVQFT